MFRYLTNVPLSETIDIVVSRLFSNNDSFLSFLRILFRKLLELAVTNSFFTFNEQLYRQKEGLGMGLPLSPVMANIFLDFHEEKWMSDCPSEFAPVFYRRYVDDCFLIFNEKEHAPLFLDYLNSKHQNINFTMETERNNQISFLDVLVRKDYFNFNTTVIRKPTFFGLGVSYFSYCCRKFKLNSIKSLVSRAYGLCSTFHNLNNEFIYIKKYFKQNGFPTQLIENTICSFLDDKYNNNSQRQNTPNQEMYVSLPYFGSQSDKFKLELSVLFRKYFNDISFHFIFVNPFKIGSFFKHKDVLPKEMRSSLIYKYSCVQCASEYIGSTTRLLASRVAEHSGRSLRTNRILAHPSHSNIREHAQTCGTPITIDNFTILDSCSNTNDLRILESLYIFKDRPVLNNMQSAHPLCVVSK